MKEYISARVFKTACMIVENRCTVREAAKVLGVSKSTVFVDMSSRLKDMSEVLYTEVCNVLQYNKAIRHLRGGEVTRKKFKEGKDARVGAN